MYDYRIVEQVSRKKKHMSGALRKVMVIFAAIFVLMGITISQAFMLPGFLLALLYFVYDIFSQRDYEYIMENGQLTIDAVSYTHLDVYKRQMRVRVLLKQ